MNFIYILFVILFVQTVLCDPKCDEGWHQYMNKCFKFHNDFKGANFYDAISICADRYQATLITIRSEKESDFLMNVVYVEMKNHLHVWLGLIRVSMDSFSWLDKSDLNYTNWYPNEPNNLNRNEYCVASLPAEGKWNDDTCFKNYLVVCQKYVKQNILQNDLAFSNNSVNQIQTELHFEECKQNLYNVLKSFKSQTDVNIILATILIIIIISIVVLGLLFKFKRILHKTSNSRNNSFPLMANALDSRD